MVEQPKPLLPTYAGYPTLYSYKAQIYQNIAPTNDGIQYLPENGAVVTLRFSADTLGFMCGDNVSVILGSTTLSTITIDCAIDSIYAVDTFTTCSSSDYRFGFNGKEKDSEGMGGGLSTYDYGFRIYNPAIAKFLSVDPLYRSYPWNSTYAFAENRVIDGVDLEGLEYATVIYKYYYGSTKPVMEVEWHNNTQHNTYGKLGKGAAFRTQYYDQNGKLASTSATIMFKRNAGIGGILDHGFYYGPTQLPGLWAVNNYVLTAVDAVDEAGRIHDRAYDFVGATADNATNSWGSIEADVAFISANQKVSKLGKGAIDPFNGQKITEDEWTAANRGIAYFQWTTWNKIEAVSDWMEKNYKSESKKGSGFFNDNETNQRSNYNLFRDKYMHQNSEGIWTENDGMWKTVGEGKKAYRAPLTPDELKK